VEPEPVGYGEDTAVVTGHNPTCFAYGEDTAVVTGHSPTCVAYAHGFRIHGAANADAGLRVIPSDI
jgi:hypothetical protein